MPPRQTRTRPKRRSTPRSIPRCAAPDPAQAERNRPLRIEIEKHVRRLAGHHQAGRVCPLRPTAPATNCRCGSKDRPPEYALPNSRAAAPRIDASTYPNGLRPSAASRCWRTDGGAGSASAATVGAVVFDSGRVRFAGIFLFSIRRPGDSYENMAVIRKALRRWRSRSPSLMDFALGDLCPRLRRRAADTSTLEGSMRMMRQQVASTAAMSRPATSTPAYFGLP